MATISRYLGKTLAIFSVKPCAGQYTIEGGGPPGTLGMMVRVWHEPSENLELLSTFGLENTRDLPKFVVFARMPDDTILQTSMRISDDSYDEAHRRLKHVISFVSSAANKIADQYKSDTENVFNAIASQIREENEREFFLKGIAWVPFLEKVKKWLSSS